MGNNRSMNMDLLTAVKVKDLKKVKEFIKKNGIPHDAEWTDYEILNVALEYNRKDVAMLLLDENCRVNKTNKSAESSTPLHNAIMLGDAQIVKKLLEKQASVLATDSDKNTSLHLAFINKNEVLVDLLLNSIQKTSNYDNLKNNQSLSHFHIACTAKDGQTVQGFLDAGANIDEAVNETSPYWAGFTAMHFAVNFMCLNTVSILLKLDAKHDTKTNKGQTPLDIATQSIEDLLIIIDLLKKKISGNKEQGSLSNFHVACLRENDKVVEKFIKYDIDINSETSSKLHLSSSSSPLHCAVASECKKKVELLLEKGSKVDCENADNMTPLHLALYNEDLYNESTTEIVDLLYTSVEDMMLAQEDNYGMSYFHIAVTRNDLAIVKKYLDRDKTFTNKIISDNPYKFYKYSPLHLAVEYQHLQMVELLLEYEADINAICLDGKPLHIAFDRGSIDLIDFLLKKSVRIDLIDCYYKHTVLHSLLTHTYYENESHKVDQLYENSDAILMYTEHLIKLGIDVNYKDKFGDTALHYICFQEYRQHDSACYFQLLLDFGADINIENDKGAVSFQLANLESDKAALIFYHHVQKLKALGLEVHPKNEETCKIIVQNGKLEEGELASMEQKRVDEIVKLKNVKLGDATTLFDFLKLDSRRAALFARCKTLKKIAMDSGVKEKYPLYGYLIRLQYNNAVKSYKNIKLQSMYNGREVPQC